MNGNDALEIQYLIAAQDGDLEAYTELQYLLEPDIRRYVARRIHDPYEADDIVQETFLAFYQNFQRIDPPENVRPYLFRIARNKCYDELRRFQRIDDDLSLDDDVTSTRISFREAQRQPRPDDAAHWMLLYYEVQSAIEQLSDNQRETLLLYSEEHMSYGEIAEIMGVSVGTVKSRLYYAKKNLRGLLDPEIAAVLDTEFGERPSNSRSSTGASTTETEPTTIEAAQRIEGTTHERRIPQT